PERPGRGPEAVAGHDPVEHPPTTRHGHRRIGQGDEQLVAGFAADHTAGVKRVLGDAPVGSLLGFGNERHDEDRAARYLALALDAVELAQVRARDAVAGRDVLEALAALEHVGAVAAPVLLELAGALGEAAGRPARDADDVVIDV